MKLMGSVAQRALLRNLREIIDRDPVIGTLCRRQDRQMPGLIVESTDSRDWASLTFCGELHRFDLVMTGGRDVVEAVGARLGQLLVAADFAIPGHIVAEIATTAIAPRSVGVAATIEVLTLIE